MSKILIAGGTGLIGKAIALQLLANNHEVSYLSRKENVDGVIPSYVWDFDRAYIDERALKSVDYIINLAGAGVAEKKWTVQRKKVIIESRVRGNQLIAEYIRSGKIQIKKYISASAIGYYGSRENKQLTEQSSAGTGFMSETCVLWEEAIKEITELNVPTSVFRIGLVLSEVGGVLPKLLLSAKFGLGTYFGKGEQIYSWIHIDDLVRMFLWTIEEPEITGTFNGTSPNAVSNKEMVKEIMNAKGGFNFLAPVPSFLLKGAMGELSEAVLSSSDVLPQKALNMGFEFKFPTIESALNDLLKS